jgi:hypothetical protein
MTSAPVLFLGCIRACKGVTFWFFRKAIGALSNAANQWAGMAVSSGQKQPDCFVGCLVALLDSWLVYVKVDHFSDVVDICSESILRVVWWLAVRLTDVLSFVIMW